MHSYSLHEKIQHGTLDFPAAYYYINPSHPHYCMPFHWHKEWELIRIRSGNVVLHADEQVFLAREGDILLFRDGMLHGSPLPEDVLYDCFVFDLHGLFRSSELMKKSLRPIYRMDILPDIYYPKETNADLYPFVSELMELHYQEFCTSTSSSCSELITISCLGHLFARILQNGHYSAKPKDTIQSAHRIVQIKSVLEYIDQNYHTEVTLEQLAKIAKMNPRYLCRVFKEITSLSPIDYVINYRIEQACRLLSSTKMSVLDVALECGFNDCSYFIRTFKQRKRLSPLQYRNGSDVIWG